MAKKIYSVTLDDDVVDAAKENSLGAKLSPIINSLLELYNVEQGKIMEMIKKIKSEETKK